MPRVLVFCLAVCCAWFGEADGRTRIQGDKLYANGTYAIVRGVNVISKVVVTEGWLDVHKYLRESSAITKFYSLLNLESYHVTTHPLLTEHEVSQLFRLYGNRAPSWEAFLGRLYPSLAAMASRLRESPILMHPTVVDIIPGRSVLALRLTIPVEEVAKVADFWKFVDERTSRAFADMPWQKMSNGADPSRGSYTFHMSLGYLYRWEASSVDIVALRQALEGLRKQLLDRVCLGSNGTARNVSGCSFDLQESRVCWFESMERFHDVEFLHNSSIRLFGGSVRVDRPITASPSGALSSLAKSFMAISAMLLVASLYVILRRSEFRIRGRPKKTDDSPSPALPL